MIRNKALTDPEPSDAAKRAQVLTFHSAFHLFHMSAGKSRLACIQLIGRI